MEVSICGAANVILTVSTTPALITGSMMLFLELFDSARDRAYATLPMHRAVHGAWYRDYARLKRHE
jgi:hypothetical protein